MVSQEIKDLFLNPLKKITFPKENETHTYIYHQHFLKLKNQNCIKELKKNEPVSKKKKKKKKKKVEACNLPTPTVEINFSQSSRAVEADDHSLKLPDRKVEKVHKWPTRKNNDVMHLKDFSHQGKNGMNNIQNKVVNTDPIVESPKNPLVTNKNYSQQRSKNATEHMHNTANAPNSKYSYPNIITTKNNSFDLLGSLLTPSSNINTGKQSLTLEDSVTTDHQQEPDGYSLPGQRLNHDKVNLLITNELGPASFAPFTANKSRNLPQSHTQPTFTHKLPMQLNDDNSHKLSFKPSSKRPATSLTTGNFTHEPYKAKVLIEETVKNTDKRRINNEPLPPGVDALDEESSFDEVATLEEEINLQKTMISIPRTYCDSDNVSENLLPSPEPLPPGIDPSPSNSKSSSPEPQSEVFTEELIKTNTYEGTPKEFDKVLQKSNLVHSLILRASNEQVFKEELLHPPGMEPSFHDISTQWKNIDNFSSSSQRRRTNVSIPSKEHRTDNLPHSTVPWFMEQSELTRWNINKNTSSESFSMHLKQSTLHQDQNVCTKRNQEPHGDKDHLMDLVANESIMDVSSLSSQSRKRIQDPDGLNRKKKKKKSQKALEASRSYLEKQRVDMQRELERRQHDAKLPCQHFVKTGECSYGDECRFSHNVAIEKRYECCKYYVSGACLKGEKCIFLHSEWPCKFYHIKGYCNSAEKCQFSHDKISNPKIQQAFEERLQFEQSLKLGEAETNRKTMMDQTKDISMLKSTLSVEEDPKSDEIPLDKVDESLEKKIPKENVPSVEEAFIFPSLYTDLS